MDLPKITNPGTTPFFTILAGNSDHGLSFAGEETRTMLSEFPFLYRFTVLSNSGGSNSPWSEFWSEFPHFMGMGVVPAPSTRKTALLDNFTSVFPLPSPLKNAILSMVSFRRLWQKGSLLKGSFDKRVRILTCRFLTYPLPTPHPTHPFLFSLICHGNHPPPHHPPEPDPKPLPQGHR